MPDTIRTSGGSARPRLGGFRATDALAAFAMALTSGSLAPAHAEELPLFDLRYLARDAYHGFGSHELAILIPMLGLVAFAAVTAVLLVRARARAARVESVSRDEIAGLRDRLDRAQALLLSERQVFVDWPAASENPGIEGDPDILGVPAPHRVLAFGSWLDAAKATEMEHAVEALCAM